MPATSFNDHDRRLSVLEDHAADTLRVMNALADAMQPGFESLDARVEADIGQALVQIQNLTGIAERGFKTTFEQATEMRTEMRSEFAALNARSWRRSGRAKRDARDKAEAPHGSSDQVDAAGCDAGVTRRSTHYE
jgi:hypothetical protein